MRLATSFLLLFTLGKIYGNEEEQFVCDKAGRYENPTDDTCNSFYLCSYTLKGELIQTQYSCPEKSIFSPKTATCSKNFTCPRISRSTRDLSEIEAVNNVHYHCRNERISNYECRRSGKYADLEGSSCRKYYLCSLMRSGKYMKTEYECPEGSLFDPRSQRCQLNYECPCRNRSYRNSETSKENERQEKKSEEWAERSRWTGRFERWTEQRRWTEIPSRQNTHEKISTTMKAITDDCLDTHNTNIFVCNDEGTFPDKKDVTCTDYYLCTKLSKGDGYLKTRYSCPYGSSFDPQQKKCTFNYECPCQLGTGSTYKTTPSSKRTTRRSTTSSEMIYTTESSAISWNCEVPTEEFICSSNGRFPDRQDLSCNTYFHCEVNEEGNISKKRYRCPRCLTFNPKLRKCTDNYVCPCSSTEAPSKTSKSTSTTASSDFSSTAGTSSSTTSSKNPKSTEYAPITQPNTKSTSKSNPKSTTSIPSSESTRETTTESGEPRESSSTRITSPSPTTEKGNTSNDCILPPSSEPFKCVSKGRFQDKIDLTCSSYFLCSELNNGSLIKTKYNCPKNSFFDPSLGRCSKKYECPCSNVPSKSTESSSVTPSKTTGSSGASGKTAKPSDNTGKTEPTGQETTSPSPTRETKSPASSKATSKASTTESSRTRNTTPSQSSSVTKSTGKSESTTSRSGSSGSSTTSNTGKPTSSESTTKSQEASTTQKGSTSDDCIVPPFWKTFKCSKKGRFPNKRDLTCSSYFLCSELNNGSLIKTKYNCPKNSFFDPSLGRCSKKYECPCSNVPSKSTESSSVTPSKTTGSSGASGKTAKPTDNTGKTEPTGQETTSPSPTRGTKSPASSKATSKASTTESSRTRNTTPSESSSITKSTGKSGSTTSRSGSSDISTSSNTGKPTNSESTTKSQESSSTQRGSTSQTRSSASSKPTSNASTTQSSRTRNTTPSESSSVTKSTGESGSTTSRSGSSGSSTTSNTGKPTISKSTTETQNSSTDQTDPSFSLSSEYTMTSKGPSTETSSMQPSSASAECIIPPSNYTFVCESKGRFSDLGDQSCSSYFLCTQLTDGTFVQARYRCGNGLKFNPMNQNCSSSYKCPCTVTTITTSTPRSSTHPTTVPDFCQPTEEFVCASVGRFPKPGDVSCCTYYSCSKSTNGTIIQTEFTCPEGTSFDPVFKTCSESYKCPCQVTESPDHFSTASDDCVIPTEEFVCSETGRFPNRQDVSCCNYFLCSDAGNGTLIRTEYNCPMGKSFDPELKRCSSSYVCPCRRTEDPQTITTSSKSPTTEIVTQPPECDSSPDNPEFVCNLRGRFKDNRDITCSKYFLCSRLRNGTFIRTRYTCPRFSYFDPTLGLCTTTYKCPCINTYPTPSRSTGRITKIPGTRAPWHINTKKTTPKPAPRECIPANQAVDDFVCSDEGKFLNPMDTKCTSYIHCVRKASVLVKTVVNCEGMTAFDVKLQKCSANAICKICTG